MCVFTTGIIDWAILLLVPDDDQTDGQLIAGYFACCCMVTAGYAINPVLKTWTASNTGNQNQRAVVFGLVLADSMSASYRYENRRRDSVKGGRPPAHTQIDGQREKDDLATDFRNVL